MSLSGPAATTRFATRARVAAFLAAVLLVLTPGLLLPPPTTAAESGTVIRLATLVPEGSIWEQTLKQAGAEWSKGTQGRVSLRIYPGGVAGSESDVVRKMRIGQLQAAALTVAGLAEPKYIKV